jgi:IS4 transposase
MQQLKDIDSLSEIEEFTHKDYRILSCFNELFKSIHTQGISRMFNACKLKGFNGFSLFQALFVLPFVDKHNVHQLVRSGINDRIDCKEDTFYRFLNNPQIPWRRIHQSFFLQIIKLIDRQKNQMDSFTEDSTPRCFILDDTILPKTGKCIEKIGKVHDHTKHKHVLGIKALVSGLWDGKIFLPFSFSLHHESGKNNKRGLREKDLLAQYSKGRDALSPSLRRINELGISKIEMAIRMLKYFFRLKTDVRYVLMDSWFVCEEILQAVKKQANSSGSPLDVIGMLKMNRMVHTTGSKRGKSLSLLANQNSRTKQIKRCKKFNCHYLKFNGTCRGVEATFFLVRMIGQQNWRCIISTDQSLSFVKAMEIYSVRWTIEVFFKEAKQHLYFGKCQSNDFDAHIATNTISCMNYMALAVKKRFNDYETIGLLFRKWKNQMLTQTLIQRIWKMLKKILSTALAELGVDWVKFLNKIILDLDLLQKIHTQFLKIFSFDYSLEALDTKCET